MILSKKILFTGVLITAVICSGLAAETLPENILKHFHFREVGPTRQGGRVVTIAVSKQDTYTFYIGAGPGGIWKSVNNGHSFTPVFDHEKTSSIGDVAIAPSDHNIIWVGTGEANLRNSTYYGDGVYKSIDGGKKWIHMGLIESHHIGRVLIHPENPDIVYVAAQGHYYTENAERGVYKTDNGGKTWKKVLEVVVEGRYVGATDMVMNPENPEIIYISTYDRIRKPWGFTGAGPGSGIYKTTNGGTTWTKLTSGLPSGLLGKIGLAIYTKSPNVLYAIIEDANSPGLPYKKRYRELRLGKPSSKPTVGNIVYRSDDAGLTWHRVSNRPVGGRANYYGQIIVDPNDKDHVYVLSSRVDESRDGGVTWSRAFRYGGDNHVLWIDHHDSRHMMMGYDYGFAITYDSGKTWYHADELPMAQLYAIGVDMEYPYNVYGGMQDFGSWKGPSTKKGRFPIRFEDWEHMKGGDGFYNQVDPTNSRWLYSSSQFGHLARIDQKTGKRKDITVEHNRTYRFNWNAPVLLSSHNPDVIYHGANILLRSSFRGEQWEEISPDLTNNDKTKFGGVEVRQYGTITTISESPVKQGIIWVGTDDGNVQVTKDGGKTWTKLNDRIPGNSEYWVTRVIASHHSAGVAYLTYTGFHRDDFRPFIYKTIDFGRTWIDIKGNLPIGSINVVKEDFQNPNLLFIGTDKTVYVTIDGGKSWSKFKNNLPTIPVHDLVIHPREKDLVVGTHGRGFFITDISPLQELTPEVLKQDIYLFDIETKVQWIMPSQPATSAQNFSGENEIHGVAINYYIKEKIKGDITLEVYQGSHSINTIKGTNNPGLNKVIWYQTKRKKRTVEEIKEWQREQKFLAEDEEFFDYYDTVDYYGEEDEEVDKLGRSLRTRVHMSPGWTERFYKYCRVLPGEYKVILRANGRALEKKVILFRDFWYQKKY